MTLSITLAPLTANLQGMPTNWLLHYDAKHWLGEKRFDIAVVLAQTAYEVCWRRLRVENPNLRSFLERRREKHPRWPRYVELREQARNVFVHQGQRPTGDDATEFLACVREIMLSIEAAVRERTGPVE